MKPYRNPDCSEAKRRAHLKKKVILETADMERIARETNAKTLKQILRDYLNEKAEADHITYLVLVQILLGFRYNGLPKDEKEQLQYEHKRDVLSGMLGELTDKTKSVCVAKGLHRDAITGDIEWVYFNAKKKVQLEVTEIENAKHVDTRNRRVAKKIEIATKPWSMRQRILRDERKGENGKGVF
jgi:hypothetical protein